MNIKLCRYHGLWRCQGRFYTTFRAALRAAWMMKEEHDHDVI